jgi:hypothetical protein
MTNQKLWYHTDQTEAEQAERLTTVARSLWSEQGTARRRMADDALTLWAGTTQHGLSGMSPMGVLGLVEETSGYNVVQAIVDTKVNHTIRNEIRPLFMTEGGDSDLREKVDAMQDACDGQREVLELEELEEQAAWNGYIFGNGGEEYSADVSNSRIWVTPVWHWNYFVSRQEARANKPQQLFSRQVIPRDVLLSFLEDASAEVLEAVRNAPAASWDDAKEFDSGEQGKVADLVIVWKGWHLPSGRVDLTDPKAFGKGDKDGRKVKANHDGLHMVCLDGTKNAPPLLVRPWPYDHFPVAWFKPNRIPGSFWGRGEPEILAATQLESNQWNERNYQVLDRLARPAIILSKGANLNPAQINNSPFNIWQVEGNPNQALKVLNEPAVSGDMIQRMDRLPAQAKDQRGMSDMSMAARRPAGIEHKPGLKYLADTETIRHIVEFRAWKRYQLDRYKNIIRCLSELSEYDPEFEVIFEKDDQLIKAKWKDITANPNQYRIKEKGTNLFSQDPSEQAEQIADLVERGLLPPSALFQAVKSPDLQALADDKEVLAKNAISTVKRVIKGPEYDESMMPTPYHDLETCKAEGLKAFNRLQMNGENPDKIERVVAFLADVDELMGITPPPPPPTPGQMAGAQNAAGGPAPLQTNLPGPPGATVAPQMMQ